MQYIERSIDKNQISNVYSLQKFVSGAVFNLQHDRSIRFDVSIGL